MASYTDAAKNLMLAALKDEAKYVSVHTESEPDSTGSGEVSGGTYARQAITWTSPSNGEMSSEQELEFDIPAGTTVRSIGLWSADTGGTFLGSQPIEPDTYAVGGVLTITVVLADLNK